MQPQTAQVALRAQCGCGGVARAGHERHTLAAEQPVLVRRAGRAERRRTEPLRVLEGREPNPARGGVKKEPATPAEGDPLEADMHGAPSADERRGPLERQGRRLGDLHSRIGACIRRQAAECSAKGGGEAGEVTNVAADAAHHTGTVRARLCARSGILVEHDEHVAEVESDCAHLNLDLAAQELRLKLTLWLQPEPRNRALPSDRQARRHAVQFERRNEASNVEVVAAKHHLVLERGADTQATHASLGRLDRRLEDHSSRQAQRVGRCIEVQAVQR
mmetsp:Transcript_8078/g.23762  ORF Transcript_8078/g.23762 Transcript_8078/m.23762 type:complete len:276 (-) Transcript_8078:834-1661(-)